MLEPNVSRRRSKSQLIKFGLNQSQSVTLSASNEQKNTDGNHLEGARFLCIANPLQPNTNRIRYVICGLLTRQKCPLGRKRFMFYGDSCFSFGQSVRAIRVLRVENKFKCVNYLSCVLMEMHAIHTR